eukprot:SAG11_NODE_6396_length_1322_cov_1.013083_1_plen_126_part_00
MLRKILVHGGFVRTWNACKATKRRIDVEQVVAVATKHTCVRRWSRRVRRRDSRDCQQPVEEFPTLAFVVGVWQVELVQRSADRTVSAAQATALHCRVGFWGWGDQVQVDMVQAEGRSIPVAFRNV